MYTAKRPTAQETATRSASPPLTNTLPRLPAVQPLTTFGPALLFRPGAALLSDPHSPLIHRQRGERVRTPLPASQLPTLLPSGSNYFPHLPDATFIYPQCPHPFSFSLLFYLPPRVSRTPPACEFTFVNREIHHHSCPPLAHSSERCQAHPRRDIGWPHPGLAQQCFQLAPFGSVLCTNTLLHELLCTNLPLPCISTPF